MQKLWNSIRNPIEISTAKKIGCSVLALLMGLILGIVSKTLDETPSNLQPLLFQYFDLRNFFSRMGIWLFCGICISIFSSSPLRAAVNTFLFFAGMVGSYYVYTIFIAGFYPKSYMMIWVGMTILSPFFAFVCWYAKGVHILSLGISAVIIMFMARQSFSFGFWYFDVRSILELFLFAGTIGML